MARARRTTRGWFFRTKQPHHYTWLIALVLAVLGNRRHAGAHRLRLGRTPSGSSVAAYVVLALGTVIEGL